MLILQRLLEGVLLRGHICLVHLLQFLLGAQAIYVPGHLAPAPGPPAPQRLSKSTITGPNKRMFQKVVVGRLPRFGKTESWLHSRHHHCPSVTRSASLCCLDITDSHQGLAFTGISAGNAAAPPQPAAQIWKFPNFQIWAAGYSTPQLRPFCLNPFPWTLRSLFPAVG